MTQGELLVRLAQRMFVLARRQVADEFLERHRVGASETAEQPAFVQVGQQFVW